MISSVAQETATSLAPAAEAQPKANKKALRRAKARRRGEDEVPLGQEGHPSSRKRPKALRRLKLSW